MGKPEEAQREAEIMRQMVKATKAMVKALDGLAVALEKQNDKTKERGK